jgi:hypothetical protein
MVQKGTTNPPIRKSKSDSSVDPLPNGNASRLISTPSHPSQYPSSLRHPGDRIIISNSTVQNARSALFGMVSDSKRSDEWARFTESLPETLKRDSGSSNYEIPKFTISHGLVLAIYVREDKHKSVSWPCGIATYPKNTQPGMYDGKAGIAVRIAFLEEAIIILNAHQVG